MLLLEDHCDYTAQLQYYCWMTKLPGNHTLSIHLITNHSCRSHRIKSGLNRFCQQQLITCSWMGQHKEAISNGNYNYFDKYAWALHYSTIFFFDIGKIDYLMKTQDASWSQFWFRIFSSVFATCSLEAKLLLRPWLLWWFSWFVNLKLDFTNRGKSGIY